MAGPRRRRWVRWAFILWASFAMSWLANSVRTQGVDEVLLRPLAQAGHAVFIVRLPWRFAPLEAHREEALARARRLIAAQPPATRWVIAGHSLGG